MLRMSNEVEDSTPASHTEVLQNLASFRSWQGVGAGGREGNALQRGVMTCGFGLWVPIFGQTRKPW